MNYVNYFFARNRILLPVGGIFVSEEGKETSSFGGSNMKNFALLQKLSIRGKQLEFIAALYAIVWGVWLLIPGWDSFSSSRVYLQMEKFAPEWIWGFTVGLIGLFQFIFLYTTKMHFRLVACALSMFAFASLGTLALFGNHESTAGPTYLIVVLCSWLGYTEILACIKEKRTICK